jgi:hypothetical protein
MITVIDDPQYPVAMLRCGAAGDIGACRRDVTIVLALDTEAEYVCDAGHRLGPVGDVDELIAARALARLASPKVWPRVRDAIIARGQDVTDSGPVTLAAWWVDAIPSQRNDMLQILIDHVAISTYHQDTDCEITIQWQP